MISVLRRIIFSHTVIKFYGHATLLFVYLVAELIIYFFFAYFQDDFDDALQYDFWISKGLGDKLYTEHYPHLKYRVQLEQFPLQASWISFFIFSLPIYNSLFLSCRLAENVSLE